MLLCGTAVARGAETTISNSPPPAVAEDNYQLNLQDKLLFSVVEDPVQTAAPDELYVNALGEIHARICRGFDDVLTLRVKGKTLRQVKAELKEKLEAEYYYQATVELRLIDQTRKGGQVLFFGAVRSNFLPLLPGEPRTIFEGVYQVGVSEFANLRKVKLTRVNPATGKPESRTIDLEAIKKGARAEDVRLEDGDRIEVPEKKIVF